MSENLNLTELIEQLQQIVDAGRFEYTPTNVCEVRYRNHGMGCGAIVELDGLSTREKRELEQGVDDARRDCEILEGKLDDARSEIARLKKLLNQ